MKLPQHNQKMTATQKGPTYMMVAGAADASSNQTRNTTPEDTFEAVDANLQEWGHDIGYDHPDVGLALKVAGDACYNNHNYEQAMRYYCRAASLLNKTMNDNMDQLAPADLHRHTGDLADLHVSVGLTSQRLHPEKKELSSLSNAVKLYHSLLRVTPDDNKQQHQSICLKIINAWNHMGNLSFDHEEYDVAMEKYHLALRDAHKLSKSFSLENNEKNSNPTVRSEEAAAFKTLRLYTANTLNNIANVYALKGESQESMKYYNKALDVQMAVLGDDDPAVATTLHNIGTSYFHCQRFELALKAFKQVLKMRRSIHGNDHSSIAEALVDIALVFDKLEEPGKSIEVHNEALRVAEKAKCDPKAVIARVHSNLGFLHSMNGSDKRALAHFQAAYDVYEAGGIKNASDRHAVEQIIQKIAEIRYDNQDDLAPWDSALSELASMFDFKDSYNPFSRIVDAFTLEDAWVENVLGCIKEERAITSV